MRFVPFFALVALGAACNPYDPDLGSRPFRCGENNACPEGYACVEYSADDKFCERGAVDEPDADPGSPDSSNFTCNDDSDIEPNDEVSSAFTTPIPDFDLCTQMVNLAICPSTDKDLYRFRVEVSATNLRATITTDVTFGELTLKVLNGSGSVIAQGESIGSDKVEVQVANLSIGEFYVQVAAPDGSNVRNNYSIEINTCAEAGCPTPCN